MPGLEDIEGRRVGYRDASTSEYRTGVVSGLILDEGFLHLAVDWESGERSTVLADALDWLDEPKV
jgi:hypothetical protein